VTDVVLTHLHRDHAAGSIDADGAPAFPGASYHLQALELDTVTATPEAEELWRPLLGPLADGDQLRTWTGAVGLLSAGSTALRLEPTPGHTAGHQSVVVAAADELLVLAGDVFLHAAQLVDPLTRYLFDDDAETAGRTRAELLDRLRDRSGTLGTAHLGVPFTRVGRPGAP
jgi:glyoxylase-like metal-dependent hydrolase (beta-lactamase superfamily II)